MITKNAQTVLEKRYFRKDEEGRVVENWEQMCWRVANAIAAGDAVYGSTPDQVEETAQAFFNLIYQLDFLPNSPALANAGTRTEQLAACFVQPVPDDLAGIYDAIKYQALIHQTGGGTGFSFSRLRPKNDLVNSTKGQSCGPVEFMEVFDRSTQAIKQGGMRRGANMGILRIDHPDILEFIDAKSDLTRLTNFNVSVAVTAAFMAAVEAGTPYDLINPRTNAVVGQLDAREVFRTVVARAWATGEPGLVFIDRMNEYCPVPWMGEYEATNPCGEQPLLPYESCNLGSLNLEQFVLEEPDGVVRVDWVRMRDIIRVATHLLENIVETNKYVEAVPEIKEISQKTRKIGVGGMGFGRMLYKLGIPYGSDAALDLAAQVMSYIDFWSKVASMELSKVRGWFPAALGHEEEFLQFFRKICIERDAEDGAHPACDYTWLLAEVERYGIRNSNTTTMAPTGTLSIIADTSGGCEPVYALAFKRFQADTHMIQVEPVFERALKAEIGDQAEAVIRRIDEAGGSLRELLINQYDELKVEWGEEVLAVLEVLADVFTVAHDVTPEEHIFIQAAFQAFNDSAISKTINFHEDATVEEVEEAYLLAYAHGCKGVTVYRNGSRDLQPLSTSTTKGAAKEGVAIADKPEPAEEGCKPSGGG